MVVLHSGPTLLTLALASAILGPQCDVLTGSSGLPGFHPKDDPAPSALPLGSENSASHRIRPILSVPDTRTCKSKENVGVHIRTSKKMKSVHRR